MHRPIQIRWMILLSILLAAGLLGFLPAGVIPALPRYVYLPLISGRQTSPAPTPIPPTPDPVAGLVNPGFELEPTGTGWTITTNTVGVPVINTMVVHSPTHAAVLGDSSNSRQASIAQTVTITTAKPVLRYYRYFDSTELCFGSKYADYVTVTVNGTEVAYYEVCEEQPQQQWEEQALNLSSYAGQTVTFKFSYTSDATIGSIFAVDDFSLTAP